MRGKTNFEQVSLDTVKNLLKTTANGKKAKWEQETGHKYVREVAEAGKSEQQRRKEEA